MIMRWDYLKSYYVHFPPQTYLYNIKSLENQSKENKMPKRKLLDKNGSVLINTLRMMEPLSLQLFPILLFLSQSKQMWNRWNDIFNSRRRHNWYDKAAAEYDEKLEFPMSCSWQTSYIFHVMWTQECLCSAHQRSTWRWTLMKSMMEWYHCSCQVLMNTLFDQLRLPIKNLSVESDHHSWCHCLPVLTKHPV